MEFVGELAGTAGGQQDACAILRATEVDGIVRGAPGEVGVRETPDVLVIVTAIDAEAPRGTLPKLRFVGVTLNGEVPVPDIVIEKFSLLMPIVVLEDFGPSVVGWNS